PLRIGPDLVVTSSSGTASNPVQEPHRHDGVTPLIEAVALKKHFVLQKTGLLGRAPVLKALDGVSLSIDVGRTLGVVGESGCGKSTLGKTLVGLWKMTSGRILIDGVD